MRVATKAVTTSRAARVVLTRAVGNVVMVNTKEEEGRMRCDSC